MALHHGHPLPVLNGTAWLLTGKYSWAQQAIGWVLIDDYDVIF